MGLSPKVLRDISWRALENGKIVQADIIAEPARVREVNLAVL